MDWVDGGLLKLVGVVVVGFCGNLVFLYDVDSLW